MNFSTFEVKILGQNLYYTTYINHKSKHTYDYDEIMNLKRE